MSNPLDAAELLLVASPSNAAMRSKWPGLSMSGRLTVATPFAFVVALRVEFPIANLTILFASGDPPAASVALTDADEPYAPLGGGELRLIDVAVNDAVCSAGVIPVAL